MKQLVGYAKYVSQTGILHSDTTITSFKCTVHLVNQEDDCYLLIIIIKYCIVAIFLWVNVFELFLNYTINILSFFGMARIKE